MTTLAAVLLICMVLYLIDKNHKWKEAKSFLIVGAISVVVFLAMVNSADWVKEKYIGWKVDRYTTQHVQLKTQTIKKYNRLAVFASTERIPVEELRKLCTDSAFTQLTEGEQAEVAGALDLNGFPNCDDKWLQQAGATVYRARN